MLCYIHIPFCAKRCKYCQFALTINKKSKMKIYLSHLLKEIENFNHIDNKLETLYLWGGTPTSYTPSELSMILSKLKEKFEFDKNLEFTLETTPDNVTENNLKAWKDMWVTRISMWVQSLDNKVLKEVTREDNSKIFQALDILENNFENVNIDFIIGLPYQKKWDLIKNIRVLIDKYTCIKHISPYMLEDYNYTSDWDNLIMNESILADEYKDVIKYLNSRWFKRYELSNTAKKNYKCKHNLWYWRHKEYVWFGLSSGSFLDGQRIQNSEDFKEYYLWKKEINTLTEEDIKEEKIIFWLRGQGVNTEIFNCTHKVLQLEKEWLIENKAWKFYIRFWQEPLENYIISELL